MDIQKARQLTSLTKELDRLENMMIAMNSGYSDEWEFRNSHTGETVDFSKEEWAEIQAMIQKKHDEILRKIKEF